MTKPIPRPLAEVQCLRAPHKEARRVESATRAYILRCGGRDGMSPSHFRVAAGDSPSSPYNRAPALAKIPRD